jgi:hypothetical protein
MRHNAETMLERPAARFIRLATVGDLVEGRVLAARLQSEGIEVRVHSPALGPYPVTVGGMAETELWVLSDRVEEASTILLDAEVNVTLAEVESPTAGPTLAPGVRLIAIIVGVVLAGMWLVRLVRVF